MRDPLLAALERMDVITECKREWEDERLGRMQEHAMVNLECEQLPAFAALLHALLQENRSYFIHTQISQEAQQLRLPFDRKT